MKILSKLRSRLSMKYIESSFTDIVSGRSVCVYRDYKGVEYLANHPYCMFNFRVKR